MKKFKCRVQNLEVRSCNQSLCSYGAHTRAEIVQYDTQEGTEYCWTIAYWDEGKEGYYLKFAGDRPFGVDAEIFMELAFLGQQKLEDYFLSKAGVNGVLADVMPCLDYTFATRLKRFVSDIQTTDQMGFEEREYIERVANQLLEYQKQNAIEQWEKDYLERRHK